MVIRVEHVQCGEYSGSDYLFAPEGKGEDWIRKQVHEVVDEMIADARKLRELAPEPTYHPEYAKFPDKTVREVREAHEVAREQWRQSKQEHGTLSRSFTIRMRERGFKLVGDMPAMEVQAYWGHNHGLELNYTKSEWT